MDYPCDDFDDSLIIEQEDYEAQEQEEIDAYENALACSYDACERGTEEDLDTVCMHIGRNGALNPMGQSMQNAILQTGLKPGDLLTLSKDYIGIDKTSVILCQKDGKTVGMLHNHTNECYLCIDSLMEHNNTADLKIEVVSVYKLESEKRIIVQHYGVKVKIRIQ